MRSLLGCFPPSMGFRFSTNMRHFQSATDEKLLLMKKICGTPENKHDNCKSAHNSKGRWRKTIQKCCEKIGNRYLILQHVRRVSCEKCAQSAIHRSAQGPESHSKSGIAEIRLNFLLEFWKSPAKCGSLFWAFLPSLAQTLSSLPFSQRDSRGKYCF